MPANLEHIFTYHPPKDDQPRKYEKIRATAKELANVIQRECPQGRDADRAIEALEMAVMLANAAVAREGQR